MTINSIGSYNISYSKTLLNKQSSPVSNKVDCLNCNQINNYSDISFKGFFSDLFTKKFSSSEEKAMYNELDETLSGRDKDYFKQLYRTGKLLNKDSNDGSSTLKNLYKIYKEPRIMGLDNQKVLSETLERLANPFVINQKFGKLPEQIKNDVMFEKSKTISNAPNEPKNKSDMNIDNSACCVAASIEFSLADKKPAEFARFVAGLSSPNFEVNKTVKVDSLNKNIMDALYLLQMFGVKSCGGDWKSVDIKISPDRDAIVRARVQNSYHDAKERSSVDVLMQSAFMQLGSQNTYNSLTDKRYGSLNSNDTGLTEFEKTFVESVVNNDGEKTSVVYQNVNDNSILEGYFHKPETVKQHLIATLDSGKNVIIGITETDSNKKIIGGHEITVVGYEFKNKKLYFLYNDTDDNHVGLTEISANDLIPKIHHAGIPINILKQPEEIPRGLHLLREFEQKNKKPA